LKIDDFWDRYINGEIFDEICEYFSHELLEEDLDDTFSIAGNN
jgi:hypothetical protein